MRLGWGGDTDLIAAALLGRVQGPTGGLQYGFHRLAMLGKDRHPQRQVGDPMSSETRYYLSSLASDTPDLAQVALDAVRSHWGVENQVPWVLDIAFRETESRIR